MNVWERYWFGRVSPVRPYLLLRVLLLVLALDVFLVMLPRGAVLGIGGFDVPHFEGLPDPGLEAKPSVHTSLLITAGVVALAVAFSGTSRIGLAFVFVSYTAAWTLSRLDSYQHHYFLSLILVTMIFLPDVRARDLGASSARSSSSAWAWTLATVTIAVVYTFTAIAKLDAEWLSGGTIRHIDVSGALAPLQIALVWLGCSETTAWVLLAGAVPIVELVIAAAYLSSPQLDRESGRFVTALCLTGWGLALALHLGIESLGLRIGWFSTYMILLASIFLLPEGSLRVVARPLRAVARTALRLGERVRERAPALAGSASLLLAGVTVALVLIWMEARAGLPGAPTGSVAVACLLLVWMGSALWRRSPGLAWGRVGTTAIAAVGFWAALTLGSVRFNYFVHQGATWMRLGRPEDALVAYLEAEPFASPRDPLIHVQIGQALRTLGRLTEAKARYVRALEIDPNHPGALNDLGVLAQGRGEFGAAAAAYRSALLADPDHAEAHANLAMVSSMTGDPDAALRHYEQAVRLKPDWLAALAGLAAAHAAVGDPERALAVCRHALEVASERGDARWVSRLQAQAAHYERAENSKRRGSR